MSTEGWNQHYFACDTIQMHSVYSFPYPISFSLLKLEDKFILYCLCCPRAKSKQQILVSGNTFSVSFNCLLCNFFHMKHQQMLLHQMPLSATVTCFSLTSLKYILSLSLLSHFLSLGFVNFLACELFTYSKGSIFSFLKCRCSYPMKIVERRKTGYFCMQSAHVVTGSLQVLSKCDLPFLSLLGFTGEICG